MSELTYLSGTEVKATLAGRELEILDAVRRAYLAHGRGQTSLPHSSFLRFPQGGRERIICLPAYLGGDFEVAGMKWIASFPGNVERGLPRATAVMVLNSCTTGLPTAILEGSLISAKRTAASAALAASQLCTEPPRALALIGTGVINAEIVRFLRAVFPGLSRAVAFDLSRERALAFAERLEADFPGLEAEVVATVTDALAAASLISIATTAVEPHLADLDACPRGATVLHVSLRDLVPDLILAANNVVDDADHVCRAQTSLHLAEQATGARDFIWCSLAELLAGTAAVAPKPKALRIFSPFGLGILDLALGELVVEQARASKRGIALDFLPPD